MRRARTVAHAAWTNPPLTFSSWSCMGPRRRNIISSTNAKPEETHMQSVTIATSESSSTSFQNSLNKSASEDLAWTSSTQTTYSDDVITCAADPGGLCSVDVTENDSDEEHLAEHGKSENNITCTENELWHQLEHELYRSKSEDVDMANEIREEEKAAVAEVAGSTSETESLLSQVESEARRFFPPGKVMHIITLPVETDDGTNDGDNDSDEKLIEPKFGIFETPRSLYGKLRLSQSMIADHFMPVYRRNIEKLVTDLEKENEVGECSRESCD